MSASARQTRPVTRKCANWQYITARAGRLPPNMWIPDEAGLRRLIQRPAPRLFKSGWPKIGLQAQTSDLRNTNKGLNVFSPFLSGPKVRGSNPLGRTASLFCQLHAVPIIVCLTPCRHFPRPFQVAPTLGKLRLNVAKSVGADGIKRFMKRYVVTGARSRGARFSCTQRCRGRGDTGTCVWRATCSDTRTSALSR
jgi:hypothetical protein